jgi:hypothetical protein
MIARVFFILRRPFAAAIAVATDRFARKSDNSEA